VLEKLAVETLDACILIQFFVARNISLPRKRVDEKRWVRCPNKQQEPKHIINRRQERERDDAHTGRRTQRTRKRGARDARALRCDYASFMLGLSKDVTFEPKPWMDQDALIDWVEHIKPIVLRMRPAARL
jgi:hypothetical protein